MSLEPVSNVDQKANIMWSSILHGRASSFEQTDVDHALERIISLTGFVNVDTHELVSWFGFFSDGKSLLGLVCHRAGGGFIEAKPAELIAKSLLAKGASVSVGKSTMSPLGHLIDEIVKADYTPSSLVGLATLLLDAGDLGEGCVDAFIKDMQTVKDRTQTYDILQKVLNVSGQKEIGQLLRTRLAAQLDAVDLGNDTPSIVVKPAPRRI